jgi:hypothetical protein
MINAIALQTTFPQGMGLCTGGIIGGAGAMVG